MAAGAAQMGARVVLVEKAKMGGDCLNYGCVPSKSLIAAGHAAEVMRTSGRYGVKAVQPEIDFAKVHDHVHGVIAAIAPNDSVERFEGLGVTVVRAAARFTGEGELAAGGKSIRARRFVIATGSRPAIPPIPGLEGSGFLTNETIFDLREAPAHLVIIGGGPIGAEMAQAHRRLGSRITQVSRGRFLAKDDREVVDVLRRRFQAEGVELLENAETTRVERGAAGGVVVSGARGGKPLRIEGSHLLVATGRTANVDALGLKAAGVAYTARGIEVDGRLRTTNKHIFAIGDVTGGYQFTHMAGYHAGIVIRNALFMLPAKVDDSAVPWVTYTDPEIAHVGMNEDAARARFGANARTVSWPFTGNDRAQAERDTEGLVKVVLGRGGRILGASIAGAGTGDQLGLWSLAVSQRLKIGAVAGTILAYPTRSEAGKRAAGEYYTQALYAARTRWLVRLIQKLF